MRGSKDFSVLENKAASALAKFSPRRRYLVGVSGGRDSIVLLHLLHRLGYRNLIVCHLDHTLRGRASRADAQFVRKLACRLDLPFVMEQLDVAAAAREKSQSIESAAREVRYDFFTRTARTNRCSAILLAHHADDQVETCLFNLFRGAGSAGLGAMRVESHRGSLHIVRPLLAVWRSEIDEYINAHRLKFREDATNRDLSNSRNRMRQQIIPMLEQHFGRELKKSVRRTAEILSAENEWISGMIEVGADELSVPDLRVMPEARQRRTIHAWLKRMKVRDIGFDAIEAVRGLLSEKTKHAKINLPGARHVRRRNKKLFLE